MLRTAPLVFALALMPAPDLALSQPKDDPPPPPPPKKELQSYLSFDGGGTLSSSEMVKKLNDKLGGQYEDLEIVFQVCGSGEFASRAAGLMGQWSVSTATDAKHKCSIGVTETTKPFDGGPDGLKIGDRHFHGYTPQYIKKLQEGKNTVGNKALHDHAEANRHQKGDDPKYASSGAAADAMTVHGGKKSNHAILGLTAGYVAVDDALSDALKAAGYTNDTITKLAQRGEDLDGRFTKKNFDKALDDLRKELDKNPKEEKAYIYFVVHGSIEERTVAFLTGGGGPGAGWVITEETPGFDIFTDEPELHVALKEELPMDGGFWADDPLLKRVGDPFLSFTTVDEAFAADAHVEVVLGGLSIGSVEMGHAAGSDYTLSFADEILSLLIPEIMSAGALTLDFLLPSSGDFFALATEADWLAREDVVDYGVRLGREVGPSLVPVPLPLSAPLLAGGTLVLLLMGRPRGPRRRGRS